MYSIDKPMLKFSGEGGGGGGGGVQISQSILMVSDPRGSLPLQAVPDVQESPSEKHPKQGFHGRPRPLTGHAGQISHPK